MRDTIEIAGLEVSCIVGVYPSERDTPQPLVVDLSLALDTRGAGAREELGATVDYGRLAGDVRFLLERCRFGLIETAAEVLARYALLPPLHDRPQVHEAIVRIQKPRALLGGAVAAVRIARTAQDAPVESAQRPWGVAERLFVGRGCVVERRRVAPRSTLGPFSHPTGDAHELMITAALTSADRALPAGAAFSYGAGRVRSYSTGATEQALLCVRDPGGAEDVENPAAPVDPLPRAVLYDAPGALSVTERLGT